ncbi:hypothetical protein [Lysinibacillus sp. Bpr_S20]|uniref:hypothetical protein n=1 Tax=Lysinibacillus sp. Bpr_S20 TaxID=2933964 RepID=UPI002010EE95|nr:hypothetical protein [Lysinibacillus sp. Bpr_S20]MCL1700796.1 hypothetical protein [Lysinibacillus sp. Bpr_S20]
MGSSLYKDTAVELYLNKLKEDIPNISEHEIMSLKYAFITRFNMGLANFESNEVKELALKMMVK